MSRLRSFSAWASLRRLAWVDGPDLPLAPFPVRGWLWTGTRCGCSELSDVAWSP